MHKVENHVNFDHMKHFFSNFIKVRNSLVHHSYIDIVIVIQDPSKYYKIHRQDTSNKYLKVNQKKIIWLIYDFVFFACLQRIQVT